MFFILYKILDAITAIIGYFVYKNGRMKMFAPDKVNVAYMKMTLGSCHGNIHETPLFRKHIMR